MIDLRHADCMDAMQDIPDRSIDAVICDLPFGSTACTWDVVIPFDIMWKQVLRVSKPTTPIILFGTQPFTSLLVSSNIKMYKYEWIWSKARGTTPLLVKKQPMRSHENISVFYAKKGTYNPQMITGTPYRSPKGSAIKTNRIIGLGKDNPTWEQASNDGTRYPLTVQTFPIHCGSKLLPTQKPLGLLEFLVKTYTNAGDTVLDFTMGSGTTGVACVATERCFIGIEKEASTYNIAMQRVYAAQEERKSA